MKPLNVVIRTVGCRSNQADSAELQSHLDLHRVTVVDELHVADVVVVNTCCVTAEAEKDCKKIVRRVLRENDGATIVLTGCAVSAFKNFTSGFSDRVVAFGGGATNLKALSEWINQTAKYKKPPLVWSSTKDRTYRYFQGEPTERAIANVDNRTRALLKIQNGCSHNCAYCIVPRARGPEQSMPQDQVLANVAAIKSTGTMELVLTGVQIGAWGKELPNRPSLAKLLERVADAFSPGRVRLSSIEPWSVDEPLIDVISGHDRVCAHLHIPLQSGDDRILAAMKRGYSRDDYLTIVRKAQTRIPYLALGTDVLCGFPGEDEEAFKNTLTLLDEISPAYVHGFPYSKRPFTTAAKIHAPSDRGIAKERVRVVRERGIGFAEAYLTSHNGRICEVLIEDPTRGITDTFLNVSISNGDRGQLRKCKLTLASNDSHNVPVTLLATAI